MAQLLLNRNITSLTAAQQFLNPLSTLNHQFDEASLSASLDFIQRCIDHHRPIFVYGDYDVDGMTSTAMMTEALRQIGAKVELYIPHRFQDGYGLNANILPHLISHQAGLLITLDCGISNVTEIAQIKAAGVAVVVIDHHPLPPVLPSADVMINPKFLPPTHTLAPLCTAGIVQKWIEFAATRYPQLNPEASLDLAALGTIADVAPLWGENRRLVSQGLSALSARSRPGLQALLEVAENGKPTLSVRDVGFTIAPRLNATGRLGHAKVGVDLLMAPTPTLARPIALQLQRLNETRQAMGQSIFADALTQLTGKFGTPGPVIALASENWHAGIIGIIASRLVERFSRPAVLIAVQDGIGRGSARTMGDISIYNLLNECRAFFKTFGGHKEAAGFSILPENIPAFQAHITQVATATIRQEDLIPTLDIDMILPPEDISLTLIRTLEEISPFGQGNPTPVFHCDKLHVIEAKQVGNGQHLKVTFTDPSGLRIIDGIGFGLGHQLSTVYQPGIDIAFHLESNTWGGRESAQLQILDIKSP